MNDQGRLYPKSPIQYVIRADARTASGAGHFVRVTVLAEELLARNEKVVFIGDTSEIPWVNNFKKSIGFNLILNDSKDFIPNPQNDVLIFDTYEADPDDEFLIENKWKLILTFVDEVSPPYKANIYVNAEYCNSWEIPISNRKSLMLSGIDYVPIRKQLRELVRRKNTTTKTFRRILITGGGSDPFGFCKEVYKILINSTLNFQAKILSPVFPLSSHDDRFEFVEMNSDLSKILKDTDFVITTAGTSCWDFLFLKMNIILACGVKNQQNNYQFLVENKLAIGIGTRSQDGLWSLNSENLLHSIANPVRIGSAIDFSIFIPDGLGASRIIDTLQSTISRT